MTTMTSSDGTPAEIPSGGRDLRVRIEIDQLDAEILRLVKRRSEVSQQIGKARMAAGGPRIVYSREMAVLARFDDLGVEGRELGMILLRLGRGPARRSLTRQADASRRGPTAGRGTLVAWVRWSGSWRQ